MKKDLLFAITITLAMGSCEGGDGGNDSDEERPDAVDGSDQGESDLSEISDMNNEDMHNEDISQEDDGLDDSDTAIPCFGPGNGGCGEGYICMQQSLPPPTCTDNYNGVCTRIPADCSTVPERIICTCDTFTPYRNDCEARKADYGGLLVDCPPEP